MDSGHPTRRLLLDSGFDVADTVYPGRPCAVCCRVPRPALCCVLPGGACSAAPGLSSVALWLSAFQSMVSLVMECFAVPLLGAAIVGCSLGPTHGIFRWHDAVEEFWFAFLDDVGAWCRVVACVDLQGPCRAGHWKT